jgi:WASH complex subunit 7
MALLLAYFKDRLDMFNTTLGGSKEVFERSQILPTMCVYALGRRLYPSEEWRDQWKALWSLQKKVPFVEGHSQVLCYISKFMMEVCPLVKKSTNIDPKDPILHVQTYLLKMSQTFNYNISVLYT